MKDTISPVEQSVLEERAAKKREQKRIWNVAHREQTRAYGRAFYQRNKEQRKASSKEYNRTHREERSIYHKEYYRRNKEEDPNYVKKLNVRSQAYRDSHREARNLKRRENYRKKREQLCNQQKNNEINGAAICISQKDCKKRNKIEIYKKTLSDYAYRSIENIKRQFPKEVKRYMELYPFEQYGEKIILGTLNRNRIYSSHGKYADCYEAGMIAYLYSVHRCAAMNYDHTIPYIRKMVRIYIICALVIYNDAKNLCSINGFSEIRLDADYAANRY